MKDLKGKTAFVTGAASGIGFGVATALAEVGAKVMLCDIDGPQLDEASQALQRKYADVESVRADASLKDEVAAAASATIARFGTTHILVNSAGVTGGGPYGAWTDAGWNWTMAVNLMSSVFTVEVFGPLIEQHGEGGHIVLVASMAGLVAVGSNPYNASKYGVVALSEGLRPELAPRGIGVSVVCPGFIRTRIMECEEHLPPRFGPASALGVPETGPFADRVKWTKGRVAAGIDPFFVGELVREGIEDDAPYIMTDFEHEAQVEARFAAIRKGFERIRNRTAG